MATKYTDLDPAEALTGAEVTAVVQDGESVQTTTAAIAALGGGGATQDLQSVLDEGAEATLDAGEVVRVGIDLNNDDQERKFQITEDGPSLKYVNDTDTMEVTVGPGGVAIGGTVGGINQALNIGSGGVSLNTPAIDEDDDSTLIAPTEWVRRAFPNGLPSVDVSGTAIAFAVPQFYGTPGAPESANITLVTTGLVKGMVQVLYHDSGTEPTYPSEFVKIFGTYSTTVLNIIYMHAISTTRIEYTICQEQ